MDFTPRQQPVTRSGNEAVVITDARLGKSADVNRRERRYVLSMLFRFVCFGLLFVVPFGWWQLALVMGAALIPPVAVVLANAIDNRSEPVAVVPYEEFHAPALTSHQVIPGEVIDGSR